MEVLIATSSPGSNAHPYTRHAVQAAGQTVLSLDSMEYKNGLELEDYNVR
jgi:hypothetical protein